MIRTTIILERTWNPVQLEIASNSRRCLQQVVQLTILLSSEVSTEFRTYTSTNTNIIHHRGSLGISISMVEVSATSVADPGQELAPSRGVLGE